MAERPPPGGQEVEALTGLRVAFRIIRQLNNPLLTPFIFCFFILTAMLFQLAMALGAPWGEFAMGGKYPGKFPPKIRVAAIIQLLVLAFFGILRSELILSSFFDFSSKAIWFVVGFFVLGTIMNLITPSKKERNLWAPITFFLLLSSLRIALS